MKKLALLGLFAAPVALMAPLAAFAQAPLPTHTVTIQMYIDGQPATADASSAGGTVFPMNSWWSAKNIGIGAGNYTLSPSGFNSNGAPYVAVTSPMSDGYSYNTRETISWVKDNADNANVSGSCVTGDPYALVGYSWGATQADAAAMAPTLTGWPRFLNQTQDNYAIIWNIHCLPQPQPVFPAKNGAWIPSSQLTHVDWTAVNDPYATVSYYYEVSNDWHRNSDGSFVTPVYKSSALSSPTISTLNTPPGVYYWHVIAKDSLSNTSNWSTFQTFKVLPN